MDKDSLRASSPIWASEASLARTRERAAKPRGAPRSRVVARLTSLTQIGELARRLLVSENGKVQTSWFCMLHEFLCVRALAKPFGRFIPVLFVLVSIV